MKPELFQLYVNASDTLLSAMQSTYKLIAIDGQLHNEDMQILALHSNIINAELLTRLQNKIKLERQHDNIVKTINVQIAKTCKYILQLLNNPHTDTPDDLRMIQNLLTATIDFIQKDYITKYIDLSPMTSDFLTTRTILQQRNTTELPQYAWILTSISKLLQIANRKVISK